MWQQNFVFRPAVECFPLNSWSWCKAKPAFDCTATYTETQYLYRVWGSGKAIQFPQIRFQTVAPILDVIGLLPPMQSQYGPSENTVVSSSGVTEYDNGIHRGCYFHLDATTTETPTIDVYAQRAYFRTDLGTALYVSSSQEWIAINSLGAAGAPYNGYDTTWEIDSDALLPDDYVDIKLRIGKADALAWLCNDNTVSSSLLANTNLAGADFQVYLSQTLVDAIIGNTLGFALALPNNVGSNSARATVNIGYAQASTRL